MEKLIADNRIWFGENGDNVPRVKRFFSETNQGLVPISIWYHDEVGHTQSASQDLKKLFDDVAYFDYPKPVGLIRKCLQIASNKDSIILDFFSGSSTTAHAVMQLNAEDLSAGQAGGGKRKFIMVQLPEICDEKSEAAKAGYKNICEIGKERIRRAGEKIVAEKPLDRASLDIGFRVLKLDDTNMEDVYYAAGEYTQEMLKGMTSNIKSDRSDMDLLFGCLLDWGLPLSLPHTQEVIDACLPDRQGTTIHTYNDGDLIACFADNVSESVVKEIAKRQPLRVVFRDSSFTSSPEKINVEEIFKHLAPNTKVRVI
jgi:adenine-specific DNA-methyltransferase